MVSITRLSGGNTPADGGDPRTFPAIWNSTATSLESALAEAPVTVSATAPSSPVNGDLWWDTVNEGLFMYYTGVDPAEWIVAGGGGGASVTISSTAPADPAAGDMWWDSDNGNLYIYYDDGTSQQWVAGNGPQVFVGTSAPAGYQGQLWFDSTTGKVYIYYDDGTSSQWVSAIGGDSQLDISSPVTGQSLIYNGTKFANAYSGLTHIHTETFSSVSAVNLDNVFSSAYDNYTFVINFTGSTTLNLRFQYRTGGVTDTSSIYRANRLYTVGGTAVSQGDTTGALAFAGYSALGEWQSKVSSGTTTFFNPFNSTNTTFVGLNTFDYSSIGPHTMHNSGSTTVTTSFDGISIYPNTGTFSGTIRVYGWSN